VGDPQNDDKVIKVSLTNNCSLQVKKPGLDSSKRGHVRPGDIEALRRDLAA